MQRCEWAGNDPIYVQYHDEEWGVPVHDDSTFFEFLVLEGAQAGLSWLTILKRRAGYRRVYEGFEPEVVAQFNEHKVQSMLKDVGIIRNKLKVRSSIKNAQIFCDIQREYGSFDKYIWGFVSGSQLQNTFETMGDVPASTSVSDQISDDLKKRGMSFVGSTIMYAFMQATGIVNDHTIHCIRHKEVSQ